MFPPDFTGPTEGMSFNHAVKRNLILSRYLNLTGGLVLLCSFISLYLNKDL